MIRVRALSHLAVVLSTIIALPADQDDPVPRVVVFGIDGMGSANVWRDTDGGVPAPAIPSIERLRKKGAWSLAARIDPLNFSGPNWTGMVTGSYSSEHGVDSNDCTRGAALPTIYEVLHGAFPRRLLAVVHEWDKIACHYEPASVGFRVQTRNERETADRVIETLADERNIFTFVHFDRLDAAGHDKGGDSAEYQKQMESIDREIGRILVAIETGPRAGSTYVILTADHGHMPAGGGHAPSDAPTPFIITGPGVVPGEIEAEVRNNQLAPLVAHIFGVAPSPVWSARLAPFDGVVIR